jgi:GAF domain-containing protein
MSDADAPASPRFDALWRTVVSDDPNLQAALRRVAEAGSAVLSDCDSASITVIERGRPVTVGSTNDTAQALDDAQYAAGEGPCLAAAQELRTVRIDDMATDERWPTFAARARARGITSSLSVPIDVTAPDTFAGFNVYGTARGGFSEADEQLSQAFAGQAGVVVANAQAYFAAFELSRNIAKAMESRAEIEQAKGILMSTHHIDADTAFDLLRQRSQRTNRKLRDVAMDVVAEAVHGGDGGPPRL